MSDMISFKREGLLDDGIYRLRIDDIEQKTSQAGNPYLNVKYAVIVRGQPRGGALWDVISLTPQSRFVVEAFLDSLGAPNTDDEVSPQWFKGKFLWARLKTGMWKDKFRNEVDSYVVGPDAEQEVVANEHEDVDFGKPPPKKQRAAQTAKAGATGQAVAEMEEEDFPL